MKIDLDHLHHWMCAIRESEDPKRTLDSFWAGQIKSKIWLIDNIKPYIQSPVSIDIHGGWNGVLASLLFQSGIPISKIRTVDIDPSCEKIAYDMNKLEEIQGRFSAVTADMCGIGSDFDLVINTSSEHISEDQYQRWINNLSNESLVVVQSNNYRIDEHIRIAESLDQFVEQSMLTVKWHGKLELPMYERYMVIGHV
jgi:hypothetical protein